MKPRAGEVEVLPSIPLRGGAIAVAGWQLGRWLGTLLGIVSGSNPEGSGLPGCRCGSWF